MRTLWAALLIGFAAINVYAFTQSSLAELWQFIAHPGPWGIVLMADLLIALFIGLTWLAVDARKREVNPLPYTILTLCTGSVGILVYLVRFWGAKPQNN